MIRNSNVKTSDTIVTIIISIKKCIISSRNSRTIIRPGFVQRSWDVNSFVQRNKSGRSLFHDLWVRVSLFLLSFTIIFGGGTGWWSIPFRNRDSNLRTFPKSWWSGIIFSRVDSESSSWVIAWLGVARILYPGSAIILLALSFFSMVSGLLSYSIGLKGF